MHIHVHIEIHNGERGSGEVGEQLASVKAMTGVLHPWSPHLNTKPVTISTTIWGDLIG